MMRKSRKKFSASFKTKVVLEAIKNQSTMQELASKYEIHPNQISSWKNEFLENASIVFETKRGPKPESDVEKDKLYKVIGEQKVEIDFLKQVLGK